MRRYTSPEEVAFFDAARAKPPELPALSFAPMLLGPARQNFNDALYAAYVGRVVPSICAPGDDGQHGSAALCDITALQALSRRVHLGHFVAERKFRDAPARYRELVAADDVDGIMAELTNAAVEERIIERVARKVAALGAGGAAGAGPDADDCDGAFMVEPRTIAAIYRELIIPLTKDIEVEYLKRRIDAPDGGPEAA